MLSEGERIQAIKRPKEMEAIASGGAKALVMVDDKIENETKRQSVLQRINNQSAHGDIARLTPNYASVLCVERTS